MNLKQLGSRIREMRERRGLKQADIARALQISAQAVSKWERGDNAPDISLLLDLSRLLGVTTDWLLGRDETDALHQRQRICRPRRAHARPRSGGLGERIV